MATVNTAITDTAFVEISTADDAIVQNVNIGLILIRFDSSLPTVGEDAITLKNGEAIQKIAGKPVGNIYARMAHENAVGKVSISE